MRLFLRQSENRVRAAALARLVSMKKLLALALVLFSLAGCGGDSESTVPTEPEPVQTTTLTDAEADLELIAAIAEASAKENGDRFPSLGSLVKRANAEQDEVEVRVGDEFDDFCQPEDVVFAIVPDGAEEEELELRLARDGKSYGMAVQIVDGQNYNRLVLDPPQDC